VDRGSVGWSGRGRSTAVGDAEGFLGPSGRPGPHLLHSSPSAMARWLSRTAALRMDWLEAFVYRVASGGALQPESSTESHGRPRTRILDEARQQCQLTDHEYNHLARVLVQSSSIEHEEKQRARARAERREEARADQLNSGVDDGPIESFNTFLAYLFCAPPLNASPPPSAAATSADLAAVAAAAEPELVFLDGTAAAALERAKEGLSEGEYAHVLQTQRRLAELSEEAERDRAMKLQPKRLPQFASAQPLPSSPAVTAVATTGALPFPRVMPTATAVAAPAAHTAAESGVAESDTVPAPRRIDSAMDSAAMEACRPRLLEDGSKPYADLFGFT